MDCVYPWGAHAPAVIPGVHRRCFYEPLDGNVVCTFPEADLGRMAGAVAPAGSVMAGLSGS